jgi:uncharacterized protein (UPF0276 family)
MDFAERLNMLPILGMGVSTEYGASRTDGALDLRALRRQAPHLGRFLEVGVEIAKGIDADARSWAAANLPTTNHFLDVNLDEEEDTDDPQWLAEVHAAIELLKPAWLCGDAGLWHIGPRDRDHMLLLPPILTADSASELSAGIRRLRASTGLEVFPENPPGSLFIGDLTLLEFFARVAEEGDTGVLLDCAHLAMYQHHTGRDPLDGLDDFPLDRIVELHVAGGSARETAGGFRWIEDDHSPDPLPETWAIFSHIVERAPSLRAVVVECERNPLPVCLPLLSRVHSVLRGSALVSA